MSISARHVSIPMGRPREHDDPALLPLGRLAPFVSRRVEPPCCEVPAGGACRGTVEALPRPSCLGTSPSINGECRPFGRHSFGALWLPNYSRRDATALRSKLLLSMWNITSSFLKDSEGMKRRTVLTLPVSHKQNRMSIGGFYYALAAVRSGVPPIRRGFPTPPRWGTPAPVRGACPQCPSR